VHRTVRVAAALIAGQAALCAVIGWVTIGASHPHRSDASASVDPLAGPPLVIPQPGVVAPLPPSPPPGPTRPASTSTVRTSGPSTPPASHRSPERPPSATVRPVGPVRLPPPTEQAQLDGTPTPDVQSPVDLLGLCDPLDALGLTADGISVRCVPGADGTPRWQAD